MHYAGALDDNGKIYKILRKSGGDTTILDAVSNRL